MRRHLRFIMESSVLTFTGMLGSYGITVVVMYNIHDPAKAAAVTVSICTVWSLVRGYFWRLWIARRQQHQE
jgi:ABC-type sulfate transport system permease component